MIAPWWLAGLVLIASGDGPPPEAREAAPEAREAPPETWVETVRLEARKALTTAGLDRRQVEDADGPLVYFTGGPDGPDTRDGRTVVMIHGMGSHAGSWAQAVPELVKDRRLVILDLVGHGESVTSDDGPLPVARLVDGIEKVLDASGSERLVLVGNSLGGWLAMHLALLRPADVEALVLVNSGGLVRDLGELKLVPDTPDELRQVFAAMGAPPLPEALEAGMIASIRNGPSPRVGAGFRAMDSMEWHLGRLARLVEQQGMDVVLIWGAADRLLPFEGYGDRLAEGLGGAPVRKLEGCGHIPQQFCPEAFSRALAAFLEETKDEAGEAQ